MEDPEKILEQTVLEMNDDLIKMRQATAQVSLMISFLLVLLNVNNSCFFVVPPFYFPFISSFSSSFLFSLFFLFSVLYDDKLSRNLKHNA